MYVKKECIDKGILLASLFIFGILKQAYWGDRANSLEHRYRVQVPGEGWTGLPPPAHERHKEAGAGAAPQVANGNGESLRGTLEVRVVRKRILRLGHADGQVPEALRGEQLHLRLSLFRVAHVSRAVQLFGDLLDLFLDGARGRVQQREPGGGFVLLARRDHRLAQRNRTLGAGSDTCLNIDGKG